MGKGESKNRRQKIHFSDAEVVLMRFSNFRLLEHSQ